jgi:hypothetical protein
MKKIEIDEEIIKKATKCQHCLNCLKNETFKCCKVDNSVQNTICFVNFDKRKICNYRMSYGYGDICNCPVRIEMYRKYKK